MSVEAALSLVVVLTALAGLAGPWVLRRLPEPAPDAPLRPDVADEPEKPGLLQRAPATHKIPYAELAARRGLGVRLMLATAVVAAVVAFRVEWGWDLLVAMPLVPVGVLLAYVDWRTTYLPTRIIAPAYAVAVVTILVAGLGSGDHDDLLRAVIGWAIYGGAFLLFWLVFPGGWGYGDVRLAGVLGLVLGSLGWPELYVGLMGGVLLGGLGGLVLTLVNRSFRKRFSYGPFMIAGAFLAMAFGSAITDALGYGSLMR